jgi:streptogramin lyase
MIVKSMIKECGRAAIAVGVLMVAGCSGHVESEHGDAGPLIAAAPGAAGTFREFPVGWGAGPEGITRGPDGNLWFTTSTGVARMTVLGEVTRFDISQSTGHPTRITAGPDGNLWFIDSADTNVVGKITPQGVATLFPLPQANVYPSAIAAGPDGNVWFTVFGQRDYGSLGRITPQGAFTFVRISSGASPTGLSFGPDGTLWFSGRDSWEGVEEGVIGELMTNSAFGQVTVAKGSRTSWIATGADGSVWVTVDGRHAITRYGAMGVTTEFAVPSTSALPASLTTGPDGNIWFVASGIGRVTPDGMVTEIPIPDPNATPVGLTVGPDGNMWFTDFKNNAIWRYSL